jgi:hypothetical protein
MTIRKPIDLMRKPELVAEAVRLGLGTKAALDAQRLEDLRREVRATLNDR